MRERSRLSSPIQGEKRVQKALAISVGLTALLYAIPEPYGFYLAYPFLLLSTLAHELGHGVAALMVGGHFDRFVLYADGSGAAHVYGQLGRFAQAFISAGGLVGPAVAAAFAFVLARRAKWAQVALTAAGALLVVAIVLVVRNLFGFFFIALVAAGALGLGLRAKAHTSQVALVFIAVQLALSVFSRGDYLFTEYAHTAQGPMPSDVANMSEALFLPYWLWGTLAGAFSLVVLAGGLFGLLRPAAR